MHTAPYGFLFLSDCHKGSYRDGSHAVHCVPAELANHGASLSPSLSKNFKPSSSPLQWFFYSLIKMCTLQCVIPAGTISVGCECGCWPHGTSVQSYQQIHLCTWIHMQDTELMFFHEFHSGITMDRFHYTRPRLLFLLQCGSRQNMKVQCNLHFPPAVTCSHAENPEEMSFSLSWFTG